MAIGRPPNVLRPTQLTTNLPEDLRAKLDIHLFSTIEGRVPHGAYSRFLVERIKEFFEPKAQQNQWGIEEAFKTLSTLTEGSDAAKGALRFLRLEIERLSKGS